MGVWGLCSAAASLSPRSAGGPRKGYMGHLTRVANALVQNTEKGPNAEQLGQLLKGEGWGRPTAGGGWGPRPHILTPHLPGAELPEEQQEKWEAFVSGPLAETNKKNTVDLVSPVPRLPWQPSRLLSLLVQPEHPSPQSQPPKCSPGGLHRP